MMQRGLKLFNRCMRERVVELNVKSGDNERTPVERFSNMML
jgi:hypothetical protein